MSSPKITLIERVFENPIINTTGLNVAIIGTANKGEVLKFEVVNSLSRFERLFGTSIPTSFSYFTIKKLLEETGNIYFCRVANKNNLAKAKSIEKRNYVVIKDINDENNGYAILKQEGQKQLDKFEKIKFKFERDENGKYKITSYLVKNEEEFLLETFENIANVRNINSITSPYVLYAKIENDICNNSETKEYEISSSSLSIQIFNISAQTDGSWYNGIKFEISKIKGTYNVLVSIKNQKNLLLEEYKLLSFDPNNEKYIEKYISERSNILSVEFNEELLNILSVNEILNLIDKNVYVLNGGKDGDLNDNEDNLITSYVEAIRQLKNKDKFFSIDFILVPDYSYHPMIISTLEEVLNTRGDVCTIVDVPIQIGFSDDPVKDAIDFTNGNYSFSFGGNLVSSKINNKNMFIYAFWVKDYDPDEKVFKWVPPSIYVLKKIAYLAKNLYIWVSAAEFTHRKLNVVDVQYSPSEEERDLMYGEQLDGRIEVINPIVYFSAEGIVIFGQRTSLRDNKPTNRINVVLMLNYFKKKLYQICRTIQFRPNNPVTWKYFIESTSSVLSYIQENGGLERFTVICDETTNTPELIANNKFSARVRIVPTALIEEIEVIIEVTPQGVIIE